MKLIKTASGKYKLTKQAWEEIGKKGGWNKTAMPVPLSDEQRAEMASEGVYFLQDMFQRLPNVTKAQIAGYINELKETGTNEFLENLDARSAISLPAIYKADPSNIVEINGSQYYVVDLTEPRDVKKKSTINGREYQKGDRYPGEIIAMDVETGLPVPFVYDEVVSRISVPQQNRQVTLQSMNDEIRAWNERIETIDKAVGVTKLALQVKWAENKIQDRINTLEAQKSAIREKIQDPLAGHPGYGNWVQFLRDGVRNGSFSLRDTLDSLLFLYQSDPQELIRGIENGEVEVPDELRNALLGLAAQEASGAQEKVVQKDLKEEERTTRMEEELPPGREIEEAPLDLLTLEDIPETKYKKLQKNKTLYHWVGSLNSAIRNIDRDEAELQNVLDAFGGLRSYLGSLEKGQRAKDYLRSDEGSHILVDLNNFLEAATSFIKRYETNIVEDGKINPKLMGRGGTAGNALIAVALNRIYNIISRTIEEALEEEEVERVREEVEEAPVPELTEPTEPVASVNDKINKLSQVLWKAFENRMRLK